MISYIPLILFVVLTNAISQALLKKGMLAFASLDLSKNAVGSAMQVAFDPWVISGLGVMAISMAAHLYVLSKVPLTFAFPFIALSYIFVLLIGYFVFSEMLNINHLIGTAFIILGLVFIGRAGDMVDQKASNLPIQVSAIDE